MQGYSYSIFSAVAIAIHLIINFNLLAGRKGLSENGSRYRGFLMGVLFYYVADAAWGVFAGLRWMGPWYFDTILYFLSLVAFVFEWCRYVIVYLDFGKWPRRILIWSGQAIVAINVALAASNIFNDCLFYFDEQGNYVTGVLRDPAIALLIVFDALMAAFVLAKMIGSRDELRRRSAMVLMFCTTIALAIILQIIWPLTPFTALGCLVCNCFFNVFVLQNEQAAKHAAELEGALARARAAEKARSLFFSIVSHDIRTPLNAILGCSEHIQHGVGSREEMDEALACIRANGTTLLRLVDDILDLAKMDSCQLTLNPEPVSLARLTDGVFASFRMAADAKGIAFANRTEDVPAVLLDGLRFRQILFNLVGNAVKFTDCGSVTVSASYAGGNLEVSVSDTGIGIPRDMLTNILEPFVQVQDPSHAVDRTGGVGLGLPICRRLVEVMGGELAVESEPGKGSTFRIRIPGVAAVAPTLNPQHLSPIYHLSPTPQPSTLIPDAPEPADVLKTPERVLVVDDSPVNRKVLAAHLKRAGVVSIGQACDGGEALAELESAMKAGNPYDLVLTDFWMPHMNGMELIEKLRGDSRFSRLHVFAVTADTEFQGDPRHRLFTGVLLKPLTYAKLVETFAVA